MSFSKLGLSPNILRSLEENHYLKPSAIQNEAIPAIFSGGDIIACAQTGTGKTAAFSLPLIQKIATSNEKWRRINVLILSPTRELASQIKENIDIYSRYVPVRSAVICGGSDVRKQERNLRLGVQIIIATPGRLLALIRQRSIDLSSVQTLVLDEADRMLDMGFIHDVKRIISALPRTDRQNLLFSATISPEIKQLVQQFLVKPKVIQVAKSNEAVKTIDQVVHHVDKNRRKELLTYLIKRENWRKVLVFTRTKRGANRLTEQLNSDGFATLAIHANKSQNARNHALDSFKCDKIRVLVATDIAARGIDIEELPNVVNFDLPQLAKDYVHRIGRTGRAGKCGKATSFVSVNDVEILKSIEKLIAKPIPREKISGFEPDINAVVPRAKKAKIFGDSTHVRKKKPYVHRKRSLNSSNLNNKSLQRRSIST